MTLPFRLQTLAMTMAFTAASPTLAQDAGGAETRPADLFSFQGDVIDLWTMEAALSMDTRPELTLPLFTAPEEMFSDEFLLWDAWPVRHRDGSIAMIDGRVILIALSAERGLFETEFSTRSQWRYWTRAAGEDWRYGGLVFPEGTALGSRQWAGSTVYDEETGRIHFFYAAVGELRGETPDDVVSHSPRHPGFGRPSTVQRVALASASVESGEDGLEFAAMSEHRVILEAEGGVYMTEEQYPADDVVYGMRDPWYFRHEGEDGRDCALFTANTNYLSGPANGVVGLGCAVDGIDGEWELREPILASDGVSAQLERPHLVRRGEDGLYLFFSSHGFLLPDAADKPAEGLFGFRAASGALEGPWLPLNGHGLVAGNPEAAPLQSYSYLVLPSLEVTSYLNEVPGLYVRFPRSEADWMGSPAPKFAISLDGDEAWVAGQRQEVDPLLVREVPR
ncbi:levansucrase [Hasllibacter halocynthiae]|uniref:Levansucrase n=1 Tax=Hasllibacter halocynthiae TaxID=595589 RepID=A0A2T0X9X4_9RHOB|nr:glycoside hydrolase family 68 protein [Hasllibacter halocynthiae]PRY95729.1 levansucrase [Hasllibacter halocynthiae]